MSDSSEDHRARNLDQQIFDFVMESSSDESSGVLQIVDCMFDDDDTDATTSTRRYTRRDREKGGVQLYEDYFSENPTFNEDLFRRRFRMRRSLFERILSEVQSYDSYFVQSHQCTGEIGLTPYQKMTAAIRLLASGCAADTVDEYLRVAESTTYVCLQRFCEAVVKIFAPEYLREPNAHEIATLLEENKARGFPGMLGSVDCMHWRWKNCPKAWAGSYSGYKGHPTVVLEAVASQNLRFWHVFFGMPGSYNDINVLNESGIFDRMMRGEAPPVQYVVNGRTYDRPYYLGDGIYPKLATIVKTIPQPRTLKEKCFAAAQESARKDVERAFGVFQARWGIIRQPARSWRKSQLHNIMVACVVLHNMIVEDESDIEKIKEYDQSVPQVVRRRTQVGRYQYMAEEYAKIRDQAIHFQLKNDLIEHMWKENGRHYVV